MRLGSVIGRITLGKAVEGLSGARWLLVSPWAREQLARGVQSPAMISQEPSVVVYDDLGGGLGQAVGFVEGREAAMPFDRPTPIDAISAVLVDEVFYSPLK